MKLTVSYTGQKLIYLTDILQISYKYQKCEISTIRYVSVRRDELNELYFSFYDHWIRGTNTSAQLLEEQTLRLDSWRNELFGSAPEGKWDK
ncbi:hypothetical protein C1645_833151 [Glomus cerebriforme]|uniref:Uncharacterized protein n=1 Tax=Glomus cerebriforme TaxID=658196 RepID=A0A397SEA4_9GLOM|nr:hypothetical protein C1645_833151 [Glomus cerebriforme]